MLLTVATLILSVFFVCRLGALDELLELLLLDMEVCTLAAGELLLRLVGVLHGVGDVLDELLALRHVYRLERLKR